MPTELSPEGLENSKILYEDGEIIFLSPLNQSALNELAPNIFSNGYRYYSDNQIYVIIDKQFIDEPYVITKNSYSGKITSAMDYTGYETDLVEIFKIFPQAAPELLEEFGPQSIFQALELIKSGKNISERELKSLDENFGKIIYNKTNPGKSMVTIEFQDQKDFFESLNLDSDDSWFLSVLFDGYSDLGFYQKDYEDEDWSEGYMIDYFDSDNMEKVKKIVELFDPEILKLTGQIFTKNAAKILNTQFRGEVEDIMSEYSTLMEECYSETMKNIVKPELCNIFQYYGIYSSSGCFYRYTTTVTILLNLFKKYGHEDYSSIKETLKSLSESQFTKIGGYYESMFEYGCNNFDSEGYNRNSGYYLDNMIRAIEDTPEKFEQMKKYAELVKKLEKLGYESGNTYSLPYDKTKFFVIKNIDNKDLRIYILEYTKLGVHAKSFSFDEFMNFLQSPELFESLVRKLNKLL